MKNVGFVFATLLICIVAGDTLHAQIPRTLSYQGVLTDNAGKPRPDGNYTFKFCLYGSNSDGSPIWCETKSLPVKSGLFSTVLGEQTPFGAAVKFDKQYWLGIQVGNEPELSPRMALTSVGYSFSSLRADTAKIAIASIPSSSDTTWRANGGNVYRLNGNVGIGTASPQRKLQISEEDVAGISFEGFTASPNAGAIRFGDGTGWKLHIGRSRETSIGSLNSENAGVLMTIQDNGNVGIGTTSPGTKFHFVGDQAFFVGTASNGYAAMDVNNTGNGPIALFRGNGNVGIGTTSPSTKFHFVGNQAYFVGNASNGYAAMDVENTGNGPIALFRGNGNVGIGTTSPVTKFHFVGDQAHFVGTASNGNSALDVVNNGNGPLAIFRGNGNVGIGTLNPTSTLEIVGRTKTCVLEITGGCDLAEPFEMSESQPIPKGALVIIDEENPGQLKLSHQAYDKRVAGVVSGAGGINPGLTLTQEGVLEGGQNVALSGRVYALATAANGPIKPGDLLTTSEVPGHAMKATDRERWDGAVIGKAMSKLEKGEGLVLVLVNLQ